MEDFEMKDTNNRKWIPVLFYIASVCYMFTGFMQMFGNDRISTGMIFMSLGWMNLALATIWKKKVGENKTEE